MWHLKFPNCLGLWGRWREAHGTEGYIFTQYFKNLFNFSFFILLSPFRYVRKHHQEDGNGSDVSKSYIVHKILVGLIQLGVFIGSVILIKSAFRPSEIKKNPGLIFANFDCICIRLLCALLVILVWRRPRTVEAVLALAPISTSGGGVYEMDPKGRRKNRWKLRAVIFGYLLFTLISQVLGHRGNWDLLNNPEKSILQPLMEGKTMTNAAYACAVVLMVTNAFGGFMIMFGYNVVIISTFAVKEIVVATKSAVRVEGPVMKNVEALLRMRDQIQTVNDLCGPVLVVVFVQIMGRAASIIGGQDYDTYTWLDTLSLPLLYLLWGVCLFVAAEAEYQARNLTSSVVYNAAVARNNQGWNESNIIDSQNLLIMINSSPGTNGLGGWKFFEISYGFLGTVIINTGSFIISYPHGKCVSLTLTYALVMLQLVLAAAPKPNEDTTGTTEKP